MPRRIRSALVAVAALVGAGIAVLSPGAASPVAAAAQPVLFVGVGQADITPITGGFKGGWACSCAKALGQHTRLYARVIVLQQGTRKVALVSEDLAFLSAGMIRDAAALLPGHGFSERNIIDSATHTHGSQGGFMNFGAYNSVLPEATNLTQFNVTDTKPDQVMYNFMTHQLASALKHADDSLAPGAIGWGHTTLSGITQNRSLEAHLADYGIDEPAGTGTVSQDPHGYAGTIDPAVDLLRVDRIINGRDRPIGVFTTFANHGTVDKENFSYFTADHQGAAERVLADSIRRSAHLNASAPMVTAFANSDAGDMTSGIRYSGPADAEYIGRREASAMFTAWQQAGQHLTRNPVFELSWTRVCMCGQSVDGHPTSNIPILGDGQAAGSEEGRTIFYELGLAREGNRLPVDLGPQGRKIPLLPEQGNIPEALPLTALRLGDRMIVTWPGEATVGVGQRLRSAVLAASQRAGIRDVVIAGYAGEYSDYWTTPQEYEQQHYEGGSTVYGEYASVLLTNEIAGLVSTLVHAKSSPAPYPYDPNNGTHVTAAGYGSGAAQGVASAQPQRASRLGHPAFAWTGGSDGIDRPVGSALVTIQRLVSGQWRAVTNDLGMQILWSVDDAGHYRAAWEVPLNAAAGSYRFVVTAKRYTLISHAFAVSTAANLQPRVTADRRSVRLDYPAARINLDWTYRPTSASSGTVTFLVGARRVTVQAVGGLVAIPSGTHVSIPVGGARDAYGNTNVSTLEIR